MRGLGQGHKETFSFRSKERLNLTIAHHSRDIAGANHKREKYSQSKEISSHNHDRR